jgi:hypothetical protein
VDAFAKRRRRPASSHLLALRDTPPVIKQKRCHGRQRSIINIFSVFSASLL